MLESACPRPGVKSRHLRSPARAREGVRSLENCDMSAVRGRASQVGRENLGELVGHADQPLREHGCVLFIAPVAKLARPMLRPLMTLLISSSQYLGFGSRSASGPPPAIFCQADVNASDVSAGFTFVRLPRCLRSRRANACTPAKSTRPTASGASLASRLPRTSGSVRTHEVTRTLPLCDRARYAAR